MAVVKELERTEELLTQINDKLNTEVWTFTTTGGDTIVRNVLITNDQEVE